MSTFSGYKTTAFKETQKFFVLDPATGSPSFVQGSDLVSYITPKLNSVKAESTRLAAENEDYPVGTLIQTSGANSPGDNFAATYLVVGAGDGDFPMLNGNELLVIKGDEFLREQLFDNTSGVGSDLVAHTGTTDTVTEALDKRTIYVGSVAEDFAGLAAAPGYVYHAKSWHPVSASNQNLYGGGLFVFKEGVPKSEHNGGNVISPTVPPVSLQAGANEAERVGNFFAKVGETDPSGNGCFVRQFDGPFYAECCGAKTNTYSQRVTINQAINIAFDYGIREVKLANKDGIYNVDVAPGSIRIKSGVVLDLNGATIQRIGTNITRRVVENWNYGLAESATPDKDFGVKNGLIVGTGGTEGISDQGACVFWFETENSLIESITTQSSNGDGIGWSRSPGAKVRNVTIGNYGRNGWSPGSGQGCDVDGVTIIGTPYAGANPGLDVDAENDTAADTGGGTWNRVTAKNLTFVDFYTAANDTFAHSYRVSNSTFGPAFKAVKVVSTNPTNASGLMLDDTNIIRVGAGGSSSTGLEVDKVSGVINRSAINLSDSAGTNVGINILNTVKRLICDGVRLDGSFDVGLQAFSNTDILQDSVFRNCDLGSIYLTGSNNLFENGSVGSVTISQGTSIDNQFGPTFTTGTISSVNGADLRRQDFAYRRGIVYPSFFSLENKVADSASPQDIVVPLPDGAGTASGRMSTVICNYSHRGDAGHWANAIFAIRHGDLGASLATTVTNTSSAIGGFSVIAASANSVTIRLEYTFAGTASFTVLS